MLMYVNTKHAKIPESDLVFLISWNQEHVYTGYVSPQNQWKLFHENCYNVDRNAI